MEQVSVEQMLGLGIRLEPEQLWMLDEHQGHGMAIWTPPDPEHELQCSEGCGYPMLLENDEPLVLPTPIRWNTSSIWLDQEALEDYGRTWDDWPSVIAQVDSMFMYGSNGWQPYRIWDVWPITSVEHKGLRTFQEMLFETMHMHEVSLLAEHEYGEYSAWEEIDGDDRWIDYEKLEAFERAGDEDARVFYMETVYEEYMEWLCNTVGKAKQETWNLTHVSDTMNLLIPELVEPWMRLRQTSRSAWRTAARCYPPDKRNVFWASQKWINPWP